MGRAGRAEEIGGPLALAALVLAYLWEFREVFPQLDDAYISYRYALNLVEGHGLVFNPGERVEGFSNLLWTLLVAAGLKLGFEAREFGHWLGVGSGAATLVATYAYARGVLPGAGRWVAVMAVVLVGATNFFARWSVAGMETALFTAAVTAALAAQARSRLWWATSFLCIATLTRPDALLFAAIVYALSLSGILSKGWRGVLAPAAFAAVVLLLTAFRLAYYGDFVPNTFHAKVGGIPLEFGFLFVMGFVADGSGFLLIPAVVAAVKCPRSRAGAICIVALFAYIVAIGSDGFGLRFFVVIVPALAVLAACGVGYLVEVNRLAAIAMGLLCGAAFWRQVFGEIPLLAATTAGCGALLWGWWVETQPSRRAALAAAGLSGVIVLGLGALQPAGVEAIRSQLARPRRVEYLESAATRARGFEARARRLANKLLDQRRLPRLVAVGAIGSIGYHSGLPILDLFGLTDREIARHEGETPAGSLLVSGHQRSHADYVMRRAPDFIFIGPSTAPDGSPSGGTPAEMDLRAHPEFDTRYVWEASMKAYRRRDFNPPPPPARSRGATRPDGRR